MKKRRSAFNTVGRATRWVRRRAERTGYPITDGFLVIEVCCGKEFCEQVEDYYRKFFK